MFMVPEEKLSWQEVLIIYDQDDICDIEGKLKRKGKSIFSKHHTEILPNYNKDIIVLVIGEKGTDLRNTIKRLHEMDLYAPIMLITGHPLKGSIDDKQLSLVDGHITRANICKLNRYRDILWDNLTNRCRINKLAEQENFRL